MNLPPWAGPEVQPNQIYRVDCLEGMPLLPNRTID
jgi:hypothetical protein